MFTKGKIIRIKTLRKSMFEMSNKMQTNSNAKRFAGNNFQMLMKRARAILSQHVGLA